MWEFKKDIYRQQEDMIIPPTPTPIRRNLYVAHAFRQCYSNVKIVEYEGVNPDKSYKYYQRDVEAVFEDYANGSFSINTNYPIKIHNAFSSYNHIKTQGVFYVDDLTELATKVADEGTSCE